MNRLKFRYPYQKIVDLKANQTTQAQWMLSEAIGKLHEEQVSLNRLHADRAACQQQMDRASVQTISVSELLTFQHYMEYLDYRIVQQNVELQSAEADVRRNQQQLSTRLVDEKVWVTLKDKAKAQFEAWVLQREQQQLDEMATARYSANEG